jgi:GH35 family endo-1,4-beta-xylanase
MNTESKSSNSQEISIEQAQYVINNRHEINNQFAKNIIKWYFSRYALDWKSFLEAKKIVQITKETPLPLQFRISDVITVAESYCS